MSALRKIREGRGLRREHVAVDADVSSEYVRLLEARRSNPTLDVARRIARALGVTVDEAFPDHDIEAADGSAPLPQAVNS